MKKLSLIFLPLLVAFVIGLDLNHQMFTDASTITDADAQEEVSESDDQSGEQEEALFKISGGDDDQSNGQWYISSTAIDWPVQFLLTRFCSYASKHAAFVSTRLPYTFSRPGLFILYHCFKAFPA